MTEEPDELGPSPAPSALEQINDMRSSEEAGGMKLRSGLKCVQNKPTHRARPRGRVKSKEEVVVKSDLTNRILTRSMAKKIVKIVETNTGTDNSRTAHPNKKITTKKSRKQLQ